MKALAWIAHLFWREPEEQWRERLSRRPRDLDRHRERRIRQAIQNRLRGRKAGGPHEW